MTDAEKADQPDVDTQDDVRRKYREALDRKKASSGGGQSHADGDSRVHDAHGPAKTSRTFRRKSGG